VLLARVYCVLVCIHALITDVSIGEWCWLIVWVVAPQVPMYNFASSQMAASVAKFGAVMLKERLTAPPTEAYTIHRKLSGAFVTAVKLQSQLPARHLFYLVAGLPEPPVAAPVASTPADAAPSATATVL
jgi:hypothetical protein